jgi:hypothetical protein
LFFKLPRTRSGFVTTASRVLNLQSNFEKITKNLKMHIALDLALLGILLETTEVVEKVVCSGLGCTSVVKRLTSKLKTLGSVPRAKERKKERKQYVQSFSPK